MGKIKEPVEAKLFCALMYPSGKDSTPAIGELENSFGCVESRSEPFIFEHTDYYKPEFGDNLIKELLVFKKTVVQDSLAEIKIITNAIEMKYADSNGNRSFNIDPGFILPSKMILASTKDYSHRLYLGRGIYAELTFMFHKKGVKFMEWTYPDYKSNLVSDFFLKARKAYMDALKAGSQSNENI